jgi:hypothetical protein
MTLTDLVAALAVEYVGDEQVESLVEVLALTPRPLANAEGKRPPSLWTEFQRRGNTTYAAGRRLTEEEMQERLA